MNHRTPAMPTHADLYLAYLEQTALARLRKELPPSSLSDLSDRARVAMQFQFPDSGSSFQGYYVQVTNNRHYFLQQDDFFRKFKAQYHLQGIDRGYLDFLEDNKIELLDFITQDQIVPLYIKYFANATILHRGEAVQKNLGSFCAKFVHTFNPTKYCALDNPIRELLGFTHESFFQSFLAISAAYRTWISEHPDAMKAVRAEVPACYSSQMTDMKLLDLVLWQRANKATAGDA